MQTILPFVAVLVALLVSSGAVAFILRFAIRVAVLERIEEVQDGKILQVETGMMPRHEQECTNRDFERRLSRLEE